MHMHRDLLQTLLAMACVLPATAARGDVVVDMPAPPKTAEPAEEAETAAPRDQAEDTAASSAVPAASTAVQPSVGQIALARYARARRRPHDTYYVSSHSRFGGYYWPSYYWHWGPSYLGGWNYFWPGWTWGHWSFTVNCSEDNSESSGSSDPG